VRIEITIVALLFIVFSCDTERTSHRDNDNLYAERFSIDEYHDFSIIRIYDPWQKSSGQELKYIVTGNIKNLPDSLKIFPVIQTPVKKAVVFSTTHIGFISVLGEQESVSGVSGEQYICDQTIREGIEKREVFDIGFAPNVNYERIISLKPDLVFLYGIESSVTGVASRLENAGIPVILIGEYLETHPLGKLEWIRVFGEIYDKESKADSIFQEVKTEYEEVASIAESIETRPGVMVGLPWKDTWYMAGGASITAEFIEDAGGEYLWKENTSTEFIPLSLESVMMKAIHADVWINTGSAGTLMEIASHDPRFQNLQVFQEGELYNNNKRYLESGGNDFWEKGVIEPHIILKDLMKIFHPERIEPWDFVYYQKLE
jgi:iron complex transport system substrate-binding protein